MRRSTLLVAMVAMVLVLVSGVALAASIQGTPGPDTRFGTPQADNISTGGSGDKIFARGGPDRAFGDSGDDVVRGQAGNDRLFGGTEADTLRGGAGNDYLTGADDGDPDVLRGGGGGFDTCVIEFGIDTFISCEDPIFI